jgi:hypothetical protein
LNLGLHACKAGALSTSLVTPPVHFALVILEMGVSLTICPAWPQTVILPISASHVARISGVNNQHLGCIFSFMICLLKSFCLFFNFLPSSDLCGEQSLHTLGMSPLIDATIFYSTVAFLFSFLCVSFDKQKSYFDVAQFINLYACN